MMLSQRCGNFKKIGKIQLMAHAVAMNLKVNERRTKLTRIQTYMIDMLRDGLELNYSLFH